MKRGLYLTAYDLSNKSDGVAKKIISQVSCFERHGIEMEVVDAACLTRMQVNSIRNNISVLCGMSYSTDLLFSYVANMSNIEQFDFLYIRKGFCDKTQIEALEKIKKRNPRIKILLEYPTYPYDKEIRGRRKFIALPIDKKYRLELKNYIDRAVTFSDDEELFGAKTLIISNAIDYDRVKIINPKTHDGINLIAVAFFGKFHGYDRLLEAMAREKELVDKYSIHFHLVGDGFAIKQYKALVERFGLEENVSFHGRLFGDELDSVYDISDIAIDTLGRHRVGCYYNSSLKGKEYGAKGLPMVSGVRTDLDKYGENFYFRVSADEEPISIQAILSFYFSLIEKETKKQLADRIRSTTKKYFDYDVSFDPVLKYVTEIK